MFKDISFFNNVSDYLSILNGCINNVFESNYLKRW